MNETAAEIVTDLREAVRAMLDQFGDHLDPDDRRQFRELVRDAAGLQPKLEAIERIAKAATAFVDEQGEHMGGYCELVASDFAGEQWQALVASVKAAGR